MNTLTWLSDLECLERVEKYRKALTLVSAEFFAYGATYCPRLDEIKQALKELEE